MKKIFSVWLVLVSLYMYNNYFLTSMIVGTYINKNYSSSSSYGEVPSRADTLILNKDNTFESSYFGKGRYIVTQDIRGASIELRGRSSVFTSKITRVWYGKPKIIVVWDLGHWYEKE